MARNMLTFFACMFLSKEMDERDECNGMLDITRSTSYTTYIHIQSGPYWIDE